jgi:hypothetical protein
MEKISGDIRSALNKFKQREEDKGGGEEEIGM